MDEEYVETPPQPLPLDAWHRSRNARMVPFAGYQMPIQYDGIMAEHHWTRENAGLFDVSHMGQLRIVGTGTEGVADAARELERLLPGDIQALKPGRMRYSLLLNPEGGIVDDLMVTNTGDDIYMVVNGATKWDDIGYLRENLPDEIAISHLDEQALLALQGPKAMMVLDRIVPGVAALVFMQAASFDWNGTPLWISRSGYTGEDGFEISLPADAATRFADALLADDLVRPIGLGARDSLRLEAGLPLYGHDIGDNSNPVEADLAFAISKRRRVEGGFPNADAILALLDEGTPRRRVGLKLAGRQPAREGATVYAGGDAVGVVTSGGFAPSVGAPIAMGYVHSDQANAGTILEIDVRGKRLEAVVVSMPFVPHNYVRKAG